MKECWEFGLEGWIGFRRVREEEKFRMRYEAGQSGVGITTGKEEMEKQASRSVFRKQAIQISIWKYY